MKEIIFFENDINFREAANNSAHLISPNIIYIGGNWDLGCLSDTFDGPERQEMWRTYFDESTYINSDCICPDEFDTENDIETKKSYFESLGKNVNRLLCSARNGEYIRIWYSECSYSVSAFHFVCSLLKDIDCPIGVIQLPHKHFLISGDWHNLTSNDLYDCIRNERILEKDEKQEYARIWASLKEYNSPLRAFVNGNLISVPENFYDTILLNTLGKTEMTIGSLIGNAAGLIPISIGRSTGILNFYFIRIYKMILQGILFLKNDTDNHVLSHKRMINIHDIISVKE